MPTLPETMTAIAIQGKGGPEVLVAEERALPEPGPGQVLIRVAAAGVNRPDVLQRKGLYPAPKGHSELPGLEVAGTVAAAGEGVTRFQAGDRVMALLNGGGYATFALAEEAATLPIPEGVSDAEAAAIPETFFTVWHNVFERGALKAGEWLLVHGGSSGIGVTAIQLATQLGAKVIVTAGSQEKCEACLELGALRAVNYTNEDFVEVVKAETAGRGVDVILDMVGGDYVDRNIRSLGDDGRLVYIGFQSGSKVTVDLMRVMLKRLTLTGSTLRIRPTEVKGAIARAIETHVLPLVASGNVRVVIDSTFPLREAAAAHARMETSQHIGKIVLTVD
ncbi:NAD(P)H quinone oxidoreductase [Hyphomicrobium nitrativorans NL23]|uniref:NAD(P)H quinone oxidoreductase n=1 Tax=Hyphomicrobium nitrativorans NL23 TaxID=1029756 RepID=V5SCH7_9HYPH|nr:NAD(P)H-quinone oxidoreductase [Hyphomicrobium nitrativorans]AHB48596.1 NAD(P)H quinone oxidoreductase [Hyphomicrobium nitrativorans NL23]